MTKLTDSCFVLLLVKLCRNYDVMYVSSISSRSSTNLRAGIKLTSVFYSLRFTRRATDKIANIQALTNEGGQGLLFILFYVDLYRKC